MVLPYCCVCFPKQTKKTAGHVSLCLTHTLLPLHEFMNIFSFLPAWYLMYCCLHIQKTPAPVSAHGWKAIKE